MLILLMLLIPFSVHIWGISIDLLARFRPEAKSAAPVGKDFQFTVLIPAHNEEIRIAGILESLARQTRHNFEAYVIADCCTDDTVKIASGFPEIKILEKVSTSTCKGDALNYALDVLGKRLRDVVVILDADCTVNPEFLEKLNAQYRTGSKAVMPDTNTLNPYESIVTAWYTIYWKMVSVMSRKAHARLKLSSNLCGCGMSFRREYLRRTVTITEDVEYFMALGCDGIRIDYADDAKVYQEQPVTLRDMFGQLYRWLSGVRSVNKLYIKPYLRSLFREFSLLKLDAFMTAQTCSAYGALMIMVIIMFIAGLLLAPRILPWLGAGFAVVWLSMLYIGITVTRRCRLDHRIMAAAVPTYCVFLVAMGFIYIYAIIHPGNRWISVNRSIRNEREN